MKVEKRHRKVCPEGHVFYKSSNCPVCPICEEKRKPQEGFLAKISAPARRALENKGIGTLDQLAKNSEKELMALHGMGPSAMKILRQALVDNGLSFR